MLIGPSCSPHSARTEWDETGPEDSELESEAQNFPAVREAEVWRTSRRSFPVTGDSGLDVEAGQRTLTFQGPAVCIKFLIVGFLWVCFVLFFKERSLKSKTGLEHEISWSPPHQS